MLRLRRYERLSVQNRRFCSNGGRLTQNFRYKGSPPPTILLLMVYKSGQIFLPFCHNARVWWTDRRTDRNLIARPRLHSMQRGKNHSSFWKGKVHPDIRRRVTPSEGVKVRHSSVTSENLTNNRSKLPAL